MYTYFPFFLSHLNELEDFPHIFFVPGRGFLTWQRQVARWVALCFGQAAVFAAAVL